MAVRGYQLAFDWSRHGTFINPGEDVTSYVNKADHIVVSYGRTEGRATEDAEVGKMDSALINTTRRFSPENTASPIAGKVLPGTTGRLQVTHPITGSITTLFYGPVDVLSVETSSAEKTFKTTCLDGWGVPGAEALSTAVYSGQRTGYLINVILDTIGWTGGRDIDAGATTVPYWWEEGTDAATAVKRLVDSEGPPSIAYVEAGTFIFRDRFHRLLRTASTTSQGLFTRIVPAGSGPAGDFKMLSDSFTSDHGLLNIANSVTFQVEQFLPGAEANIWNYSSPLVLSANEVRTFVVYGDDPFVNAQAPFSGVDYYVIAGSVASATITRSSGQSLILTLTAGGSGVTLMDGIRVRANPLTSASTTQVQVEDASSIGTFRRQKWGGTCPWASIYDATAIAKRIVSAYAQARPTVTFKFAVSPSMRAADYSRYLTMVLGINISDRITVREDEMKLNAAFIVERITHDIQQLGVIHTVELACQVVDPTQPANVFTFDVAGKGFNDGLFGVDGIDNATNLFQFDTAGHGFDQGLLAN